MDQARAWRDGTFQSIEVGGVDEINLDAVVATVLRQQPVHAAVNIFIDKDFFTCPNQTSNCVQRRHAGRECKRNGGLLQHRNLLLEGRARGVPRARVVVGTELARGRLHERGRLVNGRVRWMVWVLRTAIEDHALRRWPKPALETRKVRPQRERGQVVVLAGEALLWKPDGREKHAIADRVLHFPDKRIVVIVGVQALAA
mmetsp:Transcript_98050/g.277299  ORF Transcript_98050/g.277299 Transcript_98050/m.277299 type:complete len:200 (-) Transcript_98050:237-836(-)